MKQPKYSSITKSPWFPPVLGALGGIAYEILDENLIEGVFGSKTSHLINIAHGVVDFILPILFGILVGLAVNVMRKQSVVNHYLSIQNAKLQRDLLVNTLTSLFLHEIRNPVHNIAAALEDNRVKLPEEIDEMIHRNLNRLNQSVEQYRKWSSHFENINPKEKTELRKWLKEFTENKIRPKFRELNIEYTQEVDPVQIHMHPVLLDQSFATLFDNACEALAQEPGAKKLRLTAHLRGTEDSKVEIKLTNQGKGFSKEVLERQGLSPIDSKTGLGIGLTLLRTILEQVEGKLLLSNSSEKWAEVTLMVPGESQ